MPLTKRIVVPEVIRSASVAHTKIRCQRDFRTHANNYARGAARYSDRFWSRVTANSFLRLSQFVSQFGEEKLDCPDELQLLTVHGNNRSLRLTTAPESAVLNQFGFQKSIKLSTCPSPATVSQLHVCLCTSASNSGECVPVPAQSREALPILF